MSVIWPNALDLPDLDLLPYGIIVLDEAGDVVFYNDREEQAAHRNRLDVLGRNFFTEIAPCTNVAEFYGRFEESMADSGLVAEFAFSFPFQPNSRDVEITMRSFSVAERQLCLLVVRDISEIETVREKFILSQELVSFGEVAAGVAHNFNNILMAVSTWSAVLERELADGTPRAKRAAAELSRAIADGRAMIARIGTPLENLKTDVEDVDVNAIVAAALSRARARMKTAKPNQTFEPEVSFTKPLPKVCISASELNEVIVNLVVNAFEAVERGGMVSVSTEYTEREVRVIVRDTGVGMSESSQRKIFQPLFTTKGSKGMGLGLSTSYSTIRRFGGTIAVQSVSGQGTTFTISLPVAVRTHGRTAQVHV